MEIIAGLNRGSVQRMKKTWEAVAHTSRENFKALNMVVDSLQNYKNYREQLRKSILPCLPYFGIFLRDLTFTDVGNPAKIGDNINFEKIYMTSRILKEIQMFQRTPYSFDEDENLQPLLRRLLAMPEEMLYKHSQTIEPSMLSLSC
jgi:son of sevenless-like protein